MPLGCLLLSVVQTAPTGRRPEVRLGNASGQPQVELKRREHCRAEYRKFCFAGCCHCEPTQNNDWMVGGMNTKKCVVSFFYYMNIFILEKKKKEKKDKKNPLCRCSYFRFQHRSKLPFILRTSEMISFLDGHVDSPHPSAQTLEQYVSFRSRPEWSCQRCLPSAGGVLKSAERELH